MIQRLRRKFITDAGHEIKTPLTIIGADTDLLELEVMRHALGEMGHQILMGYHRGEGWPDGT